MQGCPFLKNKKKINKTKKRGPGFLPCLPLFWTQNRWLSLRSLPTTVFKYQSGGFRNGSYPLRAF